MKADFKHRKKRYSPSTAKKLSSLTPELLAKMFVLMTNSLTLQGGTGTIGKARC